MARLLATIAVTALLAYGALRWFTRPPDPYAAAGLERVRGPSPEADTVGVYGWTRLSDAGAPKWGLRPGDTLPELRPDAVPVSARRASLAIARREQLDPRCTRVFGRGPYLVELFRYCPMRASHDPSAFVLLDSSGALLSERALQELRIVGTCPGERDTRGRALRLVTRGDSPSC